MLLSYSVAMGIFLLFTPFLVPKLGLGTLYDITWLAIPAGEVLLVGREISSYIPSRKMQLYTLTTIVGGTAVVIAALSYLKIIVLPYGKFYAVIDPFIRNSVPIIQSVAEHQPATWGSFFYEFGALIFLILFGFVFIIQRSRNDDIFLLLWGATSVYFAASFVRLTLLLAPAFCILAAIGTVELGKPAVDIVREAVIYPKHKARVITRIGREFGVAIFLILLITIIPTFWTAVRGSYQPATIVTSSIPTAPTEGNELKYSDWLQALSWLQDNTPPSSVVFAWWDYGYWITALGNRRSIADNGTQNSTQIAMIAQTFLDNTTMAIPNLQRYNVSYVAIFITPSGGTSGGFQGFGEDGKWYWMARIGNNTMWQNYKVMYLETLTNPTSSSSANYVQELLDSKGNVVSNNTIATSNQLNTNTMLGYMMAQATNQANLVQQPEFTRVFASSNNFVFVYQFRVFRRDILNLRPVNGTIAYGQNVTFAGNLTDITGKPLAISGATVDIESSTDSGTTWDAIQTIPVSSNGLFNFTWAPYPGTYLLRAHYLATTGPYAEATTTPQQLIVQKGHVVLSIKTVPSASVGQNITISVLMSPFVQNANVTLYYSLDNKTVFPIKSINMASPIENYTWTVNVPAPFILIAGWPGDNTYQAASAHVTVSKH
jgi:asparagine N-glycosylation enzyme membrane subunit Stt3